MRFTSTIISALLAVLALSSSAFADAEQRRVPRRELLGRVDDLAGSSRRTNGGIQKARDGGGNQARWAEEGRRGDGHGNLPRLNEERKRGDGSGNPPRRRGDGSGNQPRRRGDGSGNPPRRRGDGSGNPPRWNEEGKRGDGSGNPP